MSGDDFDPKIGRIRAKGSKAGRRYLNQVLAAAARAGKCSPRRSRFDGSRIGRGAAVGRVLRSRDRLAAFRTRRAIVKARLVRLGGKGIGAARAHLRYIQRDGVQRDGSPGQLYSVGDEPVDGRAFLDHCADDRHQFRFIVSAEDGADYDDLKPLVRRLMAEMEKDLGTSLDWVAVDHSDTAHPHSHIMLRGKDDRGENLVIAREYLAHGMRERLAELVTLDLGPRTDLEIEQKLRRDIDAERLTTTDRHLIRERDEAGLVSAGHKDSFQHALRAGRLKKLEALGLAEPVGDGCWRLADDMIDRLQRVGERGDIIRTMQRELSAQGLARMPAERVVHDPARSFSMITGRVVARGLSDELCDRHYLIVDGIDGRAHFIDIGSGETVEPVPIGAIVRVVPARADPRPADRAIAAIAGAHFGRYSAELHAAHDTSASARHIEAHVRRLEAMRRTADLVQRQPDGSWSVPPNYLDRVAEIELRRANQRPVRVELLSPQPLERLAGFDGATWLDRELVADEPAPLRDAGFGREVKSALALRRQWLIDQRLADEQPAGMSYRSDFIEALRRRELLRVAGQLGEELGLSHVDPPAGSRLDGKLLRRLDLAGGRFAVIANARAFSLILWRDGLDRYLGRELSIDVARDGIAWSLGRGRSGPEIS